MTQTALAVVAFPWDGASKNKLFLDFELGVN